MEFFNKHLEAGEVVGQAQQQGLASLQEQTSPRGTGGELAFHGGEEGFQQCSPRILSAEKSSPHCGAHAVDPPALLAALGRDEAAGTELLTDIGMVAFTVKRGVGEHLSEASHVAGRLQQGWQAGTVVPRTATSGRGQNELSIQIDYGQPRQPVSPGQRLVPMRIAAPHEEGADRSRRQPRRIDGHSGAVATPATDGSEATGRFAQRLVEVLVVPPLPETVPGRVIGPAPPLPPPAQLAVLPPPLGFPEGPVLLAHFSGSCSASANVGTGLSAGPLQGRSPGGKPQRKPAPPGAYTVTRKMP